MLEQGVSLTVLLWPWPWRRDRNMRCDILRCYWSARRCLVGNWCRARLEAGGVRLAYHPLVPAVALAGLSEAAIEIQNPIKTLPSLRASAVEPATSPACVAEREDERTLRDGLGLLLS